jgi:antitoxin MazE3
MTTQITVRLPEDLVAFLDDLVSSGAVRSRADGVTHSLSRERRYRTALRDAAILRGQPDDPELDALATYQAEHPIQLDD